MSGTVGGDVGCSCHKDEGLFFVVVFSFRICLFLMEGGGDMNMCHATLGSQNIPQESVLSFCVDPRDHTQVIRLDSLHLHLLNCAASPFF